MSADITTEQRRENLAKLANYLAALPTDYAHFNMTYFAHDNDDVERVLGPEEVLAIREGSCGTVACALGHGPAAGIMPLSDHINSWGSTGFIDWDSYDELFIDSDMDQDYTWTWLFAGEWADHDNTAAGAAKRIRYYLTNGMPEGFVDAVNNDDIARFVKVYADA